MSDRRKKRPKPGVLYLGGDKYVPVILRVEERDEEGRPETLTLIQGGPDSVIELSQDPSRNHFAVVYMRDTFRDGIINTT